MKKFVSILLLSSSLTVAMRADLLEKPPAKSVTVRYHEKFGDKELPTIKEIRNVLCAGIEVVDRMPADERKLPIIDAEAGWNAYWLWQEEYKKRGVTPQEFVAQQADEKVRQLYYKYKLDTWMPKIILTDGLTDDNF